jgi:hypothetical protein
MSKEEIEKRIRALLLRITHVNDCFELYRYLIQSHEKHSGIINTAPAFFQLTEYSLQHTLMIELAKLYDENKDNKTGLKKLLNQCKQDKEIFLTEYSDVYIDCETDQPVVAGIYPVNVLDDISIFECELATKTQKIINLKGQRDKWYAHLDKKYEDVQKIRETFPMSFNDVEELIQFAGRICNRLLVDLNRGTVVTKSTNNLDVEKIFIQMERLKNNRANYVAGVETGEG